MEAIILAYAKGSDSGDATALSAANDQSQKILKRASKGAFDIFLKPMVTKENFIQSILDHQDDLVLFSLSCDPEVPGSYLPQPEGLASLLGDCRQLKLVILNGCATAGHVRALLDKGIPAVATIGAVAGGDLIPTFLTHFFTALSDDNKPVSQAFNQALKVIKIDRSDLQVHFEQKGNGVLEKSDREEPLCGLFYNDQQALAWTLPVKSEQVAGSTIKPIVWLLFAAAGMIIFFFLLWKGTFNALNKQEYFVVAGLFGIVISTFAYLVFPASSSFEGEVGPFPGKYKLTGAFVPFVLILGFATYFQPDDQQAFTFTINVYDEQTGNPIDQGDVVLQYGDGGNYSRKISEGAATFKNFPSMYRGDTASYFPKVEGYFSRLNSFVIPSDGSQTKIFLTKIPESVTVTGLILDNHLPATNAILVFGNGIARDTADAYGNFSTSLPLKDGTEIALRIYRNAALRYDNLVTLSPTVPLTISLP